MVFIVLLGITVIWYFYSRTLYQNLKDNIENIHSSNIRMNSLTDIGADVRILNYLKNPNNGINETRNGANYTDYKRLNLNEAAINL